MKKDKNNSNFNLSKFVDFGLNTPVEIPYYGVDLNQNYCWATLSMNGYDLDALCNIAVHSINNNSSNFIQYSALTATFFDEFLESIRLLNEQYFQFDIWGIFSGLQFLFLDQNFSIPDWQCVKVPGSSAHKITAMVPLSNPDSGDGGECEILANDEIISFAFDKGKIYAFPSWTHFRFKPVTSGVRLWASFSVSGPSFK